MNRGNDRDDRFFRGRNRVNVFVGGFGYPYYGYGFGYPYYGYGYGFGYPYYGYGYGYPYGYGYGYSGGGYGYSGGGYGYESQGVYNGRVVGQGDGRNRYQSEGKDRVSVAAQVQRHLARAGYYHGSIDGVVGEGTRRAIRSYERANGLRVDGQIDDQLLSTMGLGSTLARR